MDRAEGNLQRSHRNYSTSMVTITTEDNRSYLLYSLNDEISRKYERVYILFLWISAFSVIIVSAIVLVGVMYILLNQREIIDVGERIQFICAAAFLLAASCLSTFSGILTCSISSTKGKFILTILFGYAFSIALIISNIILIQTVQMKIDDGFAHRKSSLLTQYVTTIKDISYKDEWNVVYKEYNCCGLEILEEIVKNSTEILDEKKKASNQTMKMDNSTNRNLDIENITTTTISSIQVIILDNNYNNSGYIENIKKKINGSNKRDNDGTIHLMFINKEFCSKHEVPFYYRDCSWLLLNALERKLHLLRLYGDLMFPMLIIASILCILGYTVLRKLQIQINKKEINYIQSRRKSEVDT